ncbi:hypothetical protein ACQPYE_08155 [Actinosynnema sp. CA-299493]
MSDHFKNKEAFIVPEVTLVNEPNKLNVDYFAFDSSKKEVIAIEAQTIDTRGGSLRPAWDAWLSGNTADWRSFYTKAVKKGRRDTVNIGVNISNVRKRLGIQIAEKGGVFARVGIPLYVIMQNSILERLRSVIDFHPSEQDEPWDITFGGFDFDDSVNADGQLGLKLMSTTRTTYESFSLALIRGAWQDVRREDVIRKIREKPGRQLITPHGQVLPEQTSLPW